MFSLSCKISMGQYPFENYPGKLAPFSIFGPIYKIFILGFIRYHHAQEIERVPQRTSPNKFE